MNLADRHNTLRHNATAPAIFFQLPPDYSPVDVHASSFRFKAPLIYTTKRGNTPRCQLMQDFYALKYNEDGTMYKMTGYEIRGYRSSTVAGSIKPESGMGMLDGKWTKIWLVGYCADDDWNKRMLFSSKRGTWEDGDGRRILSILGMTRRPNRDLLVSCWVMKLCCLPLPTSPAMPLLTPSRVATIVLALSLLSFLWSFGHSEQFVLPVSIHDAPAQKPASVVGNPSGENMIPYVPPEGYDHAPKPKPKPKPKPEPELLDVTPTGMLNPKPVESKSSEATGEEEKKDKEDDKQKEVEKEKPKETRTASELVPVTTTFCKDVRGAPDVMVVVKTSKSDIDSHLPTHLKTLLSCVPNFAIFSDHAGKIEGFDVHDALDTISTKTKASHDEFDEYEKIQQDANYNPDRAKTKELDKWKFLPMVYKAHKMHPGSRFYIFIEADTALSWTNMLQWMDRLDYRIPYYVGAPKFLNNMKFAQGGPGIMLSYGAMKQYAKMYDERYTSSWESRVGKECCGDMVLATAMAESHVEFYSGFPLLQGERPETLDWTDRHWCAPVVSWHHLMPQEIEKMWTVQNNWTSSNGWELPQLFRDAFDTFILPLLQDTKDGWNNLSQDVKIIGPNSKKIKEQEEKEKADKEKQTKRNEDKQKTQPYQEQDTTKPKGNNQTGDDAGNLSEFRPEIDNAATSAETCKRLCEITEDCVQWRYTSKGDHECTLGKTVRLGHMVDQKGSENDYSSGWMMEKIKKKAQQWDCKEPKWKFNQ
ncbi:glycosyltransferase family 31 protein [Pleomassaria siparia CBS 279.74]|uniref:Glycosyltransferase family 31 protein n=1 Tax=Pleomassaria siparia CBS 279.74 TaxID=1314801 RepID=A0A6G1KN18_9PLEO|nr:glycosyltransferase family 31 protein [Pleomassaria siparia CBS 279.74]